MSEDIEDNLWDLLHLNTYLDLDNEMKEKCEIPKEILKRWFENSKGLLDLYQKEKERAERHKQLYLMEKDFQENKINKYLIDKICERKFELQQEYKDFEDDIRLNTLEEIHKNFLEENNEKQM